MDSFEDCGSQSLPETRPIPQSIEARLRALEREVILWKRIVEEQRRYVAQIEAQMHKAETLTRKSKSGFMRARDAALLMDISMEKLGFMRRSGSIPDWAWSGHNTRNYFYREDWVLQEKRDLELKSPRAHSIKRQPRFA